MSDHVNPIAELVGSSSKRTNDAIQNAVTCGGKALRNVDRFEIVETRCQFRDGKVADYQLPVGLNIAVSGWATDRRRRDAGAHRLED